MPAPAPQQGPGAFQWNAGGWFGAQLGSTLWLLILGLVFLAQGRVAAGFPALLAFGLANAAGLLLWSRRARLAPYLALQLLIAGIGLATLGALLSLDRLGALAEVDARFAQRPGQLYWMLAMYPALMLMFALQERAARRRRSTPG